VDRLSYNLDRLKVINKHNNELIEQSLQYIESIQALLNGDIAGTYTDRGDLADEKTGRRINLLDTRA
jgi:flagellar biosynthesis/type III secretory pathway chaperone